MIELSITGARREEIIFRGEKMQPEILNLDSRKVAINREGKTDILSFSDLSKEDRYAYLTTLDDVEILEIQKELQSASVPLMSELSQKYDIYGLQFNKTLPDPYDYVRTVDFEVDLLRAAHALLQEN